MLRTTDRKGEVACPNEPVPEDQRIVKLIGLRKQLLVRREQEQREAREAWRAARAELRELKHSWREAQKKTQDLWIEARTEFFQMRSTSGEFRRHKAIFQRMKEAASQLHLEAREAVPVCRDAGRKFFAAVQSVAVAKKQQEKLNFMRDEINAQRRAEES